MDEGHEAGGGGGDEGLLSMPAGTSGCLHWFRFVERYVSTLAFPKPLGKGIVRGTTWHHRDTAKPVVEGCCTPANHLQPKTFRGPERTS